MPKDLEKTDDVDSYNSEAYDRATRWRVRYYKNCTPCCALLSEEIRLLKAECQDGFVLTRAVINEVIVMTNEKSGPRPRMTF